MTIMAYSLSDFMTIISLFSFSLKVILSIVIINFRSCTFLRIIATVWFKGSTLYGYKFCNVTFSVYIIVSFGMKYNVILDKQS